MRKSLCSQSVRPHLRVLGAIGFRRLGARSGESAARRGVQDAYHIFTFLAMCIFVGQQLLYAYQSRSDMEKMAQVLFLVLCHTTCIAKQIAFHTSATEIDDMVTALEDPLFDQRAEGGAARLRGTARRAARLLCGYAGCALATCALWLVFAVASRARARAYDFPFWTGLGYEGIPGFIAVSLYSFYSTTLVAIGNTTMDAFIVTFLDQSKTQLIILRMNFETLTDRADVIHLQTGRNHLKVLNELFIECLIHYRKITELCAALERVFGAPLLVQFGAGGWILCMTAYRIVSLKVLSIEFASTTLFMTCILMELFLFCYYGNEVTVESDRVAQSVYGTEWTRAPPAFRRSLALVMERAKRPLRPAAGLVIPLSLDTYVKILKSSYSFYAVLRQTK